MAKTHFILPPSENLLVLLMYVIFIPQPFRIRSKENPMNLRLLRAPLFVLLVASLGTLACDLSSLSSLGLAQATKPKVTIQSPTPDAQFKEGDDVSVQSISTDNAGIVRVELLVDGATVRADAPPIATGQTSFTLIQKWKATAGSHTLSVRAFNTSGGASDPALVSITVAAAEAPTVPVILPTVPLPLGSTPSSSASALPTIPPSGATPVATATNRLPTKVPASPTINAPPGTWALAINVDPSSAHRGVPVIFNVTFLNSTGTVQGYRWFIKIYEPDAKNSKGETSKANSTFALGTSTLQAPADWKINVSDCTPYIARVFWVDPNNANQVTEFIKPDQSGGPAANFQVCP